MLICGNNVLFLQLIVDKIKSGSMKNFLITCLLCIAGVFPMAALTNIVDPAHPVDLVNDSVVIFGSKCYNLGPSALYLDGSLADPSSPYVFNDAVKAMQAVNAYSSGKVTLLVAPWVYWLDDPDDPEIRRNPDNSNGIPYAVELRCDTLQIIGLAANPENVVFAANRGQTQGALGNFTMAHFIGSSLELENVTFGNYCNVDLEYPLRPEFNREKRRQAIVQAQIGICDGADRLLACNCRFISRLNMCPFVGARRSLFKDCYMECTDDALAGSAVYLDCRFAWFSTKPFYSTSSTGAVFLNCDIDLKGGSPQYITKVPGMVTVIDTRFHVFDGSQKQRPALQWTRDVSNNTCYQSNVAVNGKSYFIDAERPYLSVDLTDKPLLAAYKVEHDGATLYNTPNLLGGDDGWDPLGMRPKIEKIQQLTGKKLLEIPVMVDFGTKRVDMQASADRLRLQPRYRLWGDYACDENIFDGTSQWSFPSVLKLYAGNSGDVTCVSGNLMSKPVSGTVSMTHDYGWRGSVIVNVAPYLKDAPAVTERPVVVYDKSTKCLRLGYKLASVDNDESFVAWYRRDSAGDTVRVRHGKVPAQSVYRPAHADEGCHIIAALTPKGDDTKPGEVIFAEFPEAISSRHLHGVDKEQKTLSTDFSDIPVHYQPVIKKGWWTFDAYKPIDTKAHDWTPDPEHGWYYGYGTDGASGIGLVQMTKGARMFYSPERYKCRDMSLSLVVEPCKPAGQGFGSATGQYMDIYIKFDPATLTGYALRIERTADYDRAVVFSLVRYDNGVVTPVSEPVASSCYRTPCNIDIAVKGNLFTASASTSAAVEARDGVAESVSLSAMIEPVDYPAFGIQHTGSTGASASLISRLSAEWK